MFPGLIGRKGPRRQPTGPATRIARDGAETHIHGWRPMALRLPFLLFLACIMLVVLLTLEALRWYSNRVGGLAFFHDTNDISRSQSFAFNYVPTIIAQMLVTLWIFTDYDVLRLEPYFQLSKPEGTSATVLFTNYNFHTTILTPFFAAWKQHWVVLGVSLTTVALRLFLPALQSSVFELKEVSVIQDAPVKIWPRLVDLDTQASWISVQALHDVASYLSSDTSLPQSRSENYAVAPVEISLQAQEADSMWHLNQTVYWAHVSCSNISIEDRFPSSPTIDARSHGETTISWNVTGISLAEPAADAQDCTLDFNYRNVLLPATEFLQVRYWEPAAADVSNKADKAPRAFATHGCSPFDIYGILIGFNSTGDAPTSTASAFGCTVDYNEAEAQITMRANSSITAVEIDEATRTDLASARFNADEFQHLLFERARATSDLVFVLNDDSPGNSRVVEFSMITQALDDFEPVEMEGSATTKTKEDFEGEIKQGVKRSFVVTMNRLFDLDDGPVTVEATRITQQVSLAVVSAAALASEAILALAVVVLLGLSTVYQRRQNFLQSDPGSIGAMCSMVTDLFSPTNLLAQPQTDFHQYSTRELRKMARNLRCHWQEGPYGRRIEIVTTDGSPVYLADGTRRRFDPMPHFLVIPFFIVESLGLAAVITAMGLTIGSLVRNGSFRHLTQSDSSVLQIVLSFGPTVVAASVSALCTSIHRNLSVLEPWVHLQRGMAAAHTSLSLNYSSQSPFVVLFKSFRDRHYLLCIVSLACVVNVVLSVVAGGLFTQELTSSALATSDLFSNYSHATFLDAESPGDFEADNFFQTSISSALPMFAWTSLEYSFVPVSIDSDEADVSYGADTLGIGADLYCERLSLNEHVKTDDTGVRSWHYSPFDDTDTDCTVNMTTLSSGTTPIALSIHFLAPLDPDTPEECLQSTFLVVGRWNFTSHSPLTDHDTIALQCEPSINLQNASVVFDQKGTVQDDDPIDGTAITSGTMYANATSSLAKYNKQFVYMARTSAGNGTYHNGSYVYRYDWPGFLTARLYRQLDPDLSSLTADLLANASTQVYQWAFSSYFSLWRDLYLQPLDRAAPVSNGTVIRSTWAMVPSMPSFVVVLIIIALDTLVVMAVFVTRRGRFKGPRMPKSFGAVIPWVAQSEMLSDFSGTHPWTTAQRQEHLRRLDKRYAFRMFLRPDGIWRFGLDQEPEAPPSDVTTGGVEDKDKDKDKGIELTVLERRESPDEIVDDKDPPDATITVPKPD